MVPIMQVVVELATPAGQEKGPRHGEIGRGRITGGKRPAACRIASGVGEGQMGDVAVEIPWPERDRVVRGTGSSSQCGSRESQVKQWNGEMEGIQNLGVRSSCLVLTPPSPCTTTLSRTRTDTRVGPESRVSRRSDTVVRSSMHLHLYSKVLYNGTISST